MACQKRMGKKKNASLASSVTLRACRKLNIARTMVSDLQRIGTAVYDRFSSSQSDTLWYCAELAKIHAQPLGLDLEAAN